MRHRSKLGSRFASEDHLAAADRGVRRTEAKIAQRLFDFARNERAEAGKN